MTDDIGGSLLDSIPAGFINRLPTPCRGYVHVVVRESVVTSLYSIIEEKAHVTFVYG